MSCSYYKFPAGSGEEASIKYPTEFISCKTDFGISFNPDKFTGTIYFCSFTGINLKL